MSKRSVTMIALVTRMLVLLLAFVALGACLALSSCGGGGGKVFNPGPGSSINVSGIWEWQVEYRDGQELTFSMLLTQTSPDKYRPKVQQDSRGTATMNGNTFHWDWNRGDGYTTVNGSFIDRETHEEIIGSGYETFNDGSPLRNFTFSATRTPAPGGGL